MTMDETSGTEAVAAPLGMKDTIGKEKASMRTIDEIFSILAENKIHRKLLCIYTIQKLYVQNPIYHSAFTFTLTLQIKDEPFIY